MKSAAQDVRCTVCDALLAKLEGGGLSIHRGGFQATVVGEFSASLVCYRPGCQKLNVLIVKPKCAGRSSEPAG